MYSPPRSLAHFSEFGRGYWPEIPDSITTGHLNPPRCREAQSPTSRPRPPRTFGEMRAHPGRRELSSAAPAAPHSPAGRTSPLGPRVFLCRGLTGHTIRVCGPLRASREVRSHLVLRQPGTATPSARHLRPAWAPNEVECRIPLPPLDTNPTPTLEALARYTSIAERENRALGLPGGINAYAAA